MCFPLAYEPKVDDEQDFPLEILRPQSHELPVIEEALQRPRAGRLKLPLGALRAERLHHLHKIRDIHLVHFLSLRQLLLPRLDRLRSFPAGHHGILQFIQRKAPSAATSRYRQGLKRGCTLRYKSSGNLCIGQRGATGEWQQK